ncbi:ribonuclease H-like YkuK family protein [Alicyclobacillus dauci]|uniref:Ribonuclease H-like YkuK family protein n=1 Tax=Alicyclobacillus dauci TaxID=1475485 RepID=A0ABY6Z3V7_9BACL|nr:ribonuclease H-like YkuK family protein [Alicyclobacillus dauci]WAH37318.1 ribonuclease H-like YkuK family protein [Alicyclobacillus dauci]
MMFRSPTLGILTLEQVAEDIVRQRLADPDARFRLIIGTDSQPQRSEATFVTAIIFHKLGRGARYYVHKEQHQHMRSLRHRMFTEASLSIQTGGLLTEQLETVSGEWHIEVHLDIGENGETKKWIREIVSWIEMNGYEAIIKPDSFGASKVADRYTK